MEALYKIESLLCFQKIPPEKLDECLADFKQWTLMQDRIQSLNEAIPDLFKSLDIETDPPKIEYASSFTWVDDGKRGLSGFNVEILFDMLKKQEKQG